MFACETTSADGANLLRSRFMGCCKRRTGFVEQWRKAPSNKAIAPTGGDIMRMAIGQRQAIWKLLLANTCATVGIILAFAAH